MCGQEHPKSAQERPKSVPRAPQERTRAARERPRATQEWPRTAQERPRATQERPKSGPRATKSLPRAAKSDSNFVFFGSKSLQERSKSFPRGFLRASASKMRCGSHFGPTFGSKKRARDLKNQGNPLCCRRFQWFRHFYFEPLSDLDFGPSWPPFWKPFGPQVG